MKVVLASASERRQELLKRIVDDFDIIVSDFNEDEVKLKSSVSDYVKEIALGKANYVANIIKEILYLKKDLAILLKKKKLN